MLLYNGNVSHRIMYLNMCLPDIAVIWESYGTFGTWNLWFLSSLCFLIPRDKLCHASHCHTFSTVRTQPSETVDQDDPSSLQQLLLHMWSQNLEKWLMGMPHSLPSLLDIQFLVN